MGLNTILIFTKKKYSNSVSIFVFPSYNIFFPRFNNMWNGDSNVLLLFDWEYLFYAVALTKWDVFICHGQTNEIWPQEIYSRPSVERPNYTDQPSKGREARNDWTDPCSMPNSFQPTTKNSPMFYLTDLHSPVDMGWSRIGQA